MKKINKILLSGIATSLLLSNSMADDIIVADENTTGIESSGNQNITVTKTGSINMPDKDKDLDLINITKTLSKNNSIINDGNLTATTDNEYIYAIHLQENNEGNITNNGNIKVSTSNGDIFGIRIEKDNNGIIKNTGSIVSGFVSIYLEGSNTGTIQNDGNITDSKRNGINIVNDNSGTIKNTGSIKTEDSSIALLGSNTGDIINEGSLTTNNMDGAIYVDVDNSGTIKNTGSIYNKTASIWIVGSNTGTIQNDGVFKSNDGIYIGGNNTGTIENNSNISIAGYGIKVENDNNGTIKNTGTIDTKDSSILIEGSNTKTGKILNEGNLISSNENGAIYIGKDNSGTIKNTGSIDNKTASIYLEGSNTGTIQNDGVLKSNKGIDIEGNNIGTITNNGTITANIGFNINGSKEGTIINNDTIVADDYILFVKDDTGSGTFTNNGKATGSIKANAIDVVNNGTITLDYNQAIFSKTYTQNNNGILNIGMHIDQNSTTAQTSTITTKGDIVFKNNSTINVNTTIPTITTINNWYQSLSDSKKTVGYKSFNNSEGLIAKSTNGTINADLSTLNFTDNSILLSYGLEKDGNNLNLIVKKSQNALYALAVALNEQSAFGAAKALDKIFANSSINSDIDTFLTQLNTLDGSDSKVDTIMSTAPLIEVASNSIVFQNLATIDGIVQSRQSNARGMNSGDKLFSEKSFWVKPFVSKTDQNNKDGYKGYKSTLKGMGIGTDGKIDENKKIGLSLFLTTNFIDTNDVKQHNDIEGYNVAVYGSSPIINSSTMLYLKAGVGLYKNDITRDIKIMNKTASAKYTSKSFSAYAKLTKKLSINDKFSLLPTVELSYNYFNNPSYSESGAGGLNLNVESFSNDTTIFGIGSEFEYKISSKTKIYGDILAHYSDDKSVNVNSSYQGADNIVFNTSTISNDYITYSVHAGIANNISQKVSVSFEYNFNQNNDEFTNHLVSGKVIWKF